MKVYLALVHYPIRNKRNERVHTSVTNLDIHDIARSCRTFGVSKYFIVTPIAPQQELVREILGHWREDQANEYNPDRQEALSYATVVDSVEVAMGDIEKAEGVRPFLVSTGANFEEADGGPLELTKRANEANIPILILFGTGWGLHEELLSQCQFRLLPIKSKENTGYNHLSVRSAVAIYLDRLLGK